MAWIEPKTDWNDKDYFNVSDYNRIIGNVAFLQAFADALFYGLSISSIGDEKSVISPIYASEINQITSELESLNKQTYNLKIGEIIVYKPNGPTPMYTDINRIENACAKLYQTIESHKYALKKLAFTLGGQKGISV